MFDQWDLSTNFLPTSYEEEESTTDNPVPIGFEKSAEEKKKEAVPVLSIETASVSRRAGSFSGNSAIHEQGLTQPSISFTFDEYNFFNSQLYTTTAEVEAQKLLEQLNVTAAYTDCLITKSDTLHESLSLLRNRFSRSEKEMLEFSMRCDELTSGERTLLHTADKIQESWNYFQPLKELSKLLHKPAPDLVTKYVFKDALSQLYRCIAFLQLHNNFLDSPEYLEQYERLLSNALGIIRTYFIRSIKSALASTQRELSRMDASKVMDSSLMYARFSVVSRITGPLLEEVQAHLDLSPMGVQVVNDCIREFLAARKTLLVPLVESLMNNYAREKNLTTYIQNSFAFFKLMVDDELKLYSQFFRQESPLLPSFWTEVVSSFQGLARSLILHEHNLDQLCRNCSLLQAETKVQQDSNGEDTQSYYDFLNTTYQQVLQTLQSRILFVVHNTYINSIEKYTPLPEDMQPELRPDLLPESMNKLNMGEKPLTAANTEYLSNLAASQGWYPPVQKSIEVLSKVYRLLNSHVFDEIAHEIVHICIASLVSAGNAFAKTSDPQSSRLFLVKNFLILKRQIEAFDIEFANIQVGIDFHKVWQSIREWKNGLHSLWDFAQQKLPGMVTNMVDARQELDQQLRIAVNLYIETATRSFTDCLQTRRPEAANQMLEKLNASFSHIEEQCAAFFTEDWLINLFVRAIQEDVVRAYEAYVSELESTQPAVTTVSLDQVLSAMSMSSEKGTEGAEEDLDKSAEEGPDNGSND
ncbi:hypothetical protein SJAG_01459 [Schizosaccharomyces japonicus yFS275]|uniref:Conserved oligomeric Golgi complex subunit 3 n=1 Tax=Schizosaccharomyces japonicus (strain yFS275 / FY16936) TaxID=402676 RepID=B6JXZ9_SCHJY|nr:hypothetical protein SJAG_01459 [Schizosaccharomyces japonicus yFS275]EEB06417.2 hypothetical protein SJAG_01459 [Schizosaccharomyces japonicus yFS275]